MGERNRASRALQWRVCGDSHLLSKAPGPTRLGDPASHRRAEGSGPGVSPASGVPPSVHSQAARDGPSQPRPGPARSPGRRAAPRGRSRCGARPARPQRRPPERTAAAAAPGPRASGPAASRRPPRSRREAGGERGRSSAERRTWGHAARRGGAPVRAADWPARRGGTPWEGAGPLEGRTFFNSRPRIPAGHCPPRPASAPLSLREEGRTFRCTKYSSWKT